MELENTRWWHWVLLSIPIGWALAYFNSAPVNPLDRTAQDPLRFEDDVLHAPVGPTHIPWVRNLTVYPIIVGALHVPVQVITYDALFHKPGGEADEFIYKAKWYCSRIPYVATANTRKGPVLLQHADPEYNKEATAARNGGKLPPGFDKRYLLQPGDSLESITASVYGKDTAEGEDAIARANEVFRTSHSVQTLMASNRLRAGQALLIPWSPNSQKNVRDWLDAEGANYSWVKYQFAWWKLYSYQIWMGGAFAVIGVLWPFTLRMLTGAGLGGAKVEQKHYDMSRFGTGPEIAGRKEPKEMSDADKQQLTSLTAKLEASAKEGLGERGTMPMQAAPGQIRDLKAVALDPSATAQKPEDDKEFKGEFYPVAQPGDKPKPPEKPK